jgi:hypothetical protein
VLFQLLLLLDSNFYGIFKKKHSEGFYCYLNMEQVSLLSGTRTNYLLDDDRILLVYGFGTVLR